MEKDFFELYSKKELLALEVGHSSVCDWTIHVYDRRGKDVGNWGDPVVSIQKCTRELAFATAFVELDNYFSETFGGY